MVDSIDLANELPVAVNSAKVFLVALWSKLDPPTQESEITGKWFVGICTAEKKKGFATVYFGRATRRFLPDSGSKPAHIELNCLKLHQSGCSGYIESIPDHLDPDITVFLIHDIIAMVSDVSYANSGKWFFKNYHQIEKFFQLVKKIDQKPLFETILSRYSKTFY